MMKVDIDFFVVDQKKAQITMVSTLVRIVKISEARIPSLRKGSSQAPCSALPINEVFENWQFPRKDKLLKTQAVVQEIRDQKTKERTPPKKER